MLPPSETPGESAPITLPGPLATPPAVDWYGEASLAGEAVLRRESQERERRARIAPESDEPRGLSSKSPPRFGWNPVTTQRIEPLPEGGMQIRLSDRCFLVVSAGIFPLCSLQKPSARGDLFERMESGRDDWIGTDPASP